MRAFLLIALLFSALFAGAQDTEKAQRIKASYLLALGRLPSSGELQYWNGQANVPVGTLVDLHKQYLKGNPSVLRVVVTKSYADALGYAPSEAELAYHTKTARSYNEYMQGHLAYVSANKGEYEKVIRRSYKTAFGKEPTASEVAYWQGQSRYSYTVLLQCHREYAQRQSRSNVISVSGLASVALSPAVAREARSAAGISGNGLIAAGAANIISNNGGTIISNNGGTIISNNGGTIVSNNGGNIVVAGKN